MVINSADRQLVVTNDIQDVVVVNTEDAVYVSSKERVDDIKNIISENKEKYENYFDYNRISYREWESMNCLMPQTVTRSKGNGISGHEHESASA